MLSNTNRDFFLQNSAKEKAVERSFQISIYDSLSKKQVQIDVSKSYVSFLAMERSDFEEIMAGNFKQLLKSVLI